MFRHLVLSVISIFSIQDKVNDKQVDTAVNKGSAWLLNKMDSYLKGTIDKKAQYAYVEIEELALYTLAHANINEKNSTFKKLFDKTLAKNPDQKSTYKLAVEIMLLVKLDAARFQKRIAECAQVLANTQCKNGQWSYCTSRHYKPNFTEDKTPYTHDKNAKFEKIEIKREKWGPEEGDSSNSQYAAMGLRAALEAKVEIDPEIIKLAIKVWEKTQNDDGGWEYLYLEQGSSLGDKKIKPRGSYGSMTVGGISALACFFQILNEDVKGNAHIKKGLEWIGKNFAVDKNPCFQAAVNGWQYYYLYGLERAGSLVNLDKMGSHDWYKEGAVYLLKNQESGGNWNGEKNNSKMKWGIESVELRDTCFAILFLKRATEHLFETGK